MAEELREAMQEAAQDELKPDEKALFERQWRILHLCRTQGSYLLDSVISCFSALASSIAIASARASAIAPMIKRTRKFDCERK